MIFKLHSLVDLATVSEKEDLLNLPYFLPVIIIWVFNCRTITTLSISVYDLVYKLKIIAFSYQIFDLFIFEKLCCWILSNGEIQHSSSSLENYIFVFLLKVVKLVRSKYAWMQLESGYYGPGFFCTYSVSLAVDRWWLIINIQIFALVLILLRFLFCCFGVFLFSLWICLLLFGWRSLTTKVVDILLAD